MMAMEYIVTPLTQIDFGATGADEVVQNVAFILSTVKFSCPLDREFGWEPDIDSPILAAEATNIARVLDAIQTNEPRAIVEEIRIEGDRLNGEIKPVIRVSIDESI